VVKVNQVRYGLRYWPLPVAGIKQLLIAFCGRPPAASTILFILAHPTGDLRAISGPTPIVNTPAKLFVYLFLVIKSLFIFFRPKYLKK
jgi:hypothetical protein